MATVEIPSLLRDLTAGAERVEVDVPAEPFTVADLLAALEARFPGFRERILEEGALMPNLAVFIDGEQGLLGLREKVRPGSIVLFIPPTMGGG